MASAGEAQKPISIDKPLAAYWNFDEPLGNICRDSSGNGCDASLEQSVKQTDGIFGGGLSLTASHHVKCGVKPIGDTETTLPAISLSAWVQPTGFDLFNEIFRKDDNDHRVLFSFQESGHVLSLGLNINGYVECDAKIDPSQVLDGNWHHTAATYDGRFMRVYLDGKQIGEIERPGAITAGGNASGCIGSSNGSECFHGTMDELRIYTAALTAEDVAQLFQNGKESVDRIAAAIQAILDAFYAADKSFAETLTASRRNLVEKKLSLDPRIAKAFFARIQTVFPEECQQFRLYTGAAPDAYLTANGNEFNKSVMDRLIEMLMEYKPLTDWQWSHQTPEDRRLWDEADKLEQQYKTLLARGDESQFSPEWIELMLATGQRIQWRPYMNEPVAPYITPKTPETRSLTAEEGRAALERDWLHQADKNPTPARIKDEIRWTRELAQRLASVNCQKELDDLAALESELEKPNGKAADLYFKVRNLKRAIMFKNPAVDFTKMLFVDMPYPTGSEWMHETRHRLGYMAVPGARLLVLDGLRPDGNLTQVMPQSPLHGSFWRPDLSFDGKKIVFCFKPHNEKAFHLYEINVDGTDLRQLTDGQYDDLDPIYTPDGHIIFSTTRSHSYVRCMPPTNAFVLARCEADGSNIYLISSNNEPDYLASVMNDGRIIYTRWEYTDKPLWRAQKLWTIHPDGTQVQTFWGNQSVWPDVVKDARAIPGSRRVMVTGSAHHNWFSGAVAIIDPDQGFNFPQGVKKVTADVPWPEVGNGPVDPIESPNYHTSGNYPAYYSPYPLSEHDFIVSANRDGKFLLYLMDTDGNRELIYEGVNNIFHAQPVKSRPCPNVITDQVAWPSKSERLNPKDGVIFSGDIYQGAPAELRGKAKFLRVIHIEPKTYTYWNHRPYISTGPVVSAVQSEGVKRLLGTVPIEPDGSVAFHAPSGMSLHFQLLDENQRALQTMRSFVNVMPGEYRGCLGCHESHSKAPTVGSRSMALVRKPREITPPAWEDTTVSYARYVRPMLDKHCACCHEGNGEARKTLDFTPRPGFLGWDETYFTLIGKPTWGSAYQLPENAPPGFGIADTLMVEAYSTTDPAAYRTPAPMTRLSYHSRLVDLVSNGKHHDVKLDATELQRLIVWIDTMCPYRGDEEVREEADPVFQGVDWLSIRPKIKTAPRIARPGPVD
jgi:hypothetical protein